jgi:hypothetical protein
MRCQVLNTVSGLVSKVEYRIPSDRSEVSISNIPPTDSPKVRPSNDPQVNSPSISRRSDGWVPPTLNLSVKPYHQSLHPNLNLGL